MKTIPSDDIALSRAGAGEPAVLFLPGWCGDRTVFDGLVDRLGRHRLAVSLDWPGHGGSPYPAEDFGTDRLVADALAVIERTGAERVVPVALSHAGWVAIELRRRLGAEAVPAVVLLDWMFLGPPPPFLDALAGLQSPGAWEEVRSGLFSMWTSGLDLPPLLRYVASMGEYGFDMWSRAGREIAASFARHGSPAAALERLEPPCPTLHLYAQPDDPGLLQAQQRYAEDHPWFAVHKLDGRSHFPMFEVPDLLAELIERYVADAAVS